ncbi:non-canonical purine NTP pyrophosphatase [Candidatus Woesearchaeota archaeon]|nr:non-canonical purine NTP pyrophosphatase [Candidatus Woesearchaeota archaeon]
MKIHFVTSNENKVREIALILGSQFEIIQTNLDLPELRADTNEEVAEMSAKTAFKILGEPLIVEDSGFFLDALDGFPGTCTAYSHKRIGNDGFVRLMDRISDRACYYRTAIALAYGDGVKIFSGEEKGFMATEVRGNKGWGQDPIFIPDGSIKTYGETRSLDSINIFRKRAAEKLRAYITEFL